MNKRGGATQLLFEIMIAVFALWIMAELHQSFADTEYFSNSVIAEDTALFIDAMYAAPGNARLVYHNALTDKVVEFKDNRLSVGQASADYVSGHRLLEARFRNISVLPLIASGGQVYFDTAFSYDKPLVRQLSCPKVDTVGNIGETRILLDPQHGGADTGYVYQQYTSAALTSKIAHAFTLLHPNFRRTVTVSRPFEDAIAKDTEVSIPARMSKGISQGSKLLISVTVGGSLANIKQQPFRVYYVVGGPHSDKSAKLACLIVNNLMKEFGLDTGSVIPLSSLNLYQDNTYRILQAHMPGVVVEVGNVFYSSPKNILNQPERIAKQIYQGVESYYGTNR